MKTTSAKDRLPWMSLLSLTVAATFCCYGFLEYQRKQAAWIDAHEQYKICRSLVAQIQRLETVPKFAALSADSAQAISERIEMTARETLPEGALVSIQPESAQRLRNTSYLVNPTNISLQDVTLLELAGFARSLESADHGLVVSELRLTESTGDFSPPERWSSELKLTQTVYSATFPSAR